MVEITSEPARCLLHATPRLGLPVGHGTSRLQQSRARSLGRLLRDHRSGLGSGLTEIVGVEVGEELVEQQTETIDVGGGRDALPPDLLRSRVARGEKPGARHGLEAPLGRAEHLGDAEVEQLDDSLTVDQDVVGLEISMHDQIAVCVRDRRADLQEEVEPLIEGAGVAPAVVEQGLAVDQLHGPSRAGRPR